MSPKSPLVLLILDGWGYNTKKEHNAIALARTPHWDSWWHTQPQALLQASGPAVGLPEGQMGNSEVGHMHIGAGRIIQQDFTRINAAMDNQSFQNNPVLQDCIKTLKKTGNALHILGLLSPGGVHSHENHLFHLLALCHHKGFHSVYLHLFLDGRDTPPQSALDSIQKLDTLLQECPVGTIASVCGRYYAMDRDARWERTASAYHLISQGVSEHAFDTVEKAVQTYYQQGLSDEFIPPTLIGSPHAIETGDAVLFFNFRADRARQLTSAFIAPSFRNFERGTPLNLSSFISMTQYDKQLPTRALFPPVALKNTLAEVLSKKGLRQLRLAETEKYAHVTFFFNGGREQPFSGEERRLIPSLRIATYDLQPQMSAPMLTDALIDAVHSGVFDVLICNYANADMVGHSGNIKASIAAIECLDLCMHKVWEAVASCGGQMLITADHGNAEKLFDETTQQAHTAHTSEPVPLLYLGSGWHATQHRGSLVDVAPTVLTLLGIDIPKEMTGTALLERTHAPD